MRLLIAARLFGSSPRPFSSHLSIATFVTAGGSKLSSEGPLTFLQRDGRYSHHAWLAATLMLWPGRALPAFWMLCQPCHENSWLSQITTNGQRARASWRRSEEHTSELQSLRHLVCRL